VHNLRHGGPPVTLGSDFPGAEARSWGPRRALLVCGALAGAAALAWVFLASAPLDRLVAGAIALTLAGLTLLGLRRRLVAGPRGLLISGIGGTRIVPWSQVRGLDARTSQRFGVLSTTMEIDMVDDDLVIFGFTDLGADPAEVLEAIRRWYRP